MLTEVKTPREVFYQPQRLMVPLFQRPYVWSKEGQWESLWGDVMRLADRRSKLQSIPPHFLGAVVLQQQSGPIGALPVRTIIDGQQRLTTMQLLLDATYEQVRHLGYEAIARQVQDLVENPAHFTSAHEDRFKVWPTNRDRVAFNEVMSAQAPVDHNRLESTTSRMVLAHKYFSQSIGEWLQGENVERKANGLVEAVSSLLQLVVIQLQPDEDAQEIFETLNARGTPLTAADLIKNFVFQRLNVTAEEAERAYHQYWEAFETPFWETEVSVGRVNYSRSSLFLNQWLISQSLKDVPAKEVFAQFKRHITDLDEPIEALLPKIRESAKFYRSITERASNSTSILSRLELFIYRTSTLESEVVKPFVLWLYDPNRTPIPDDQRNMALASVESWLVRRICVRASTKNHNRVLVDLLNTLARHPRDTAGDATEAFLRSQTGPNDYWPGDEEVRRELATLPIYKRFRRGRLRMLLEGIEDYRRGWLSGRRLHEQPVVRGTTTIEHILPQEWSTNWPISSDSGRVTKRDDIVQTLGNLTLVTQALNSKVSNGPWKGPNGKYHELKRHTSLLITREVVDLGQDEWAEEFIEERTDRMVEEVLAIWPVPSGHMGKVSTTNARPTTRVEVADLVNIGFLVPGQTLFARVQRHRGRTCQVSEDGSLYVGETRYESLSAAAKGITGSQSEAGWWFWIVDMESERSVSDLRQEYLEALDEEDAVSEFRAS